MKITDPFDSSTASKMNPVQNLRLRLGIDSMTLAKLCGVELFEMVKLEMNPSLLSEEMGILDSLCFMTSLSSNDFLNLERAKTENFIKGYFSKNKLITQSVLSFSNFIYQCPSKEKRNWHKLLKPKRICRDMDYGAEILANMVRSEYGLGNDPIKSMIDWTRSVGIDLNFVSEGSEIDSIQPGMIGYSSSNGVIAVNDTLIKDHTLTRKYVGEMICRSFFEEGYTYHPQNIDFWLNFPDANVLRKRSVAFSSHFLAPRKGVEEITKNLGAWDSIKKVSSHFEMNAEQACYHLSFLFPHKKNEFFNFLPNGKKFVFYKKHPDLIGEFNRKMKIND